MIFLLIIFLRLTRLIWLGFVLNFWDIFIFQILVKSILDLANCSSKEWKHFWNLRPFWSNFFMHLKDECIFLNCPLSPDNGWVDNVVPPLPALSAEPAWKEPSNNNPILSAILHDFFFEDRVFLLAPLGTWINLRFDIRCSLFWITKFSRTHCYVWILWGTLPLIKFGVLVIEANSLGNGMILVNFLEVQPPLEAPDFSFIWHELAQPVPWLISINVNKPSQFLILINQNIIRYRNIFQRKLNYSKMKLWLTSSDVQIIFSAGVLPTLVLFFCVIGWLEPPCLPTYWELQSCYPNLVV